jgi:CubicO group peptidase (beta-lactamase class C family)
VLLAACSGDDAATTNTSPGVDSSIPSTAAPSTNEPAATTVMPVTTEPVTTESAAETSAPAAADEAEANVSPGRSWARAEATDLGFDRAALDAIAAEAREANSTCLLVVRDGRIAAEWNWGDPTAATPREVFSVTKSVTSALAGIAEADGSLAVDDAASEFIPEWRGTESETVTVEDLLSNDSGREWSLGID